MKKLVFAVVLIAALCGIASAQSKIGVKEKEIEDALSQLAKAALTNDVAAAGALYDDRLVLTSQSGKVYSKTDALADIKNAFEIYRNDDLRFVHLSKNVIVVNYQNTRKRKTLDEAKFRVTAVFERIKGKWRIVSLQSTRIATGM